MPTSFFTWLDTQQGRADFVGQFARFAWDNTRKFSFRGASVSFDALRGFPEHASDYDRAKRFVLKVDAKMLQAFEAASAEYREAVNSEWKTAFVESEPNEPQHADESKEPFVMSREVYDALTNWN